jgi:hypothetical protein
MCNWMGELRASLFRMLLQKPSPVIRWVQEGLPVQFEALNRQQRQLLQAVCWPLPELLLRTALVCGRGEPLFVGAAAAAATCAVACWHAPDMHAAATTEKQRHLSGLLDSWLQLMQQLLLQQPLARRPDAAGAGAAEQQFDDTSQQQHSAATPRQRQQQQVPGLLFQAAATARLLPADSSTAHQLLSAHPCSCGSHACDYFADAPLSRYDSRNNGGSNGAGSSDDRISSVSLRCDTMRVVENLIDCLAAMQVGTVGWGPL